MLRGGVWSPGLFWGVFVVFPNNKKKSIAQEFVLNKEYNHLELWLLLASTTQEIVTERSNML